MGSDHKLFLTKTECFMTMYRLEKNGKTYGYYQGETKYIALANARWFYTWATLDHLKKATRSHSTNYRISH